MSVIQLNGSNFSQVTTSVTPWLVSFSADWCGPCKALKPEFQEAAAQLEGVVKLGYLHADRENSLAAKYGVKGFPTVIFFNAGSVEVYTGQRKAKSIVQYARVKTGVVGVPSPEAAPIEKSLVQREGTPCSSGSTMKSGVVQTRNCGGGATVTGGKYTVSSVTVTGGKIADPGNQGLVQVSEQGGVVKYVKK